MLIAKRRIGETCVQLATLLLVLFCLHKYGANVDIALQVGDRINRLHSFQHFFAVSLLTRVDIKRIDKTLFVAYGGVVIWLLPLILGSVDLSPRRRSIFTISFALNLDLAIFLSSVKFIDLIGRR